MVAQGWTLKIDSRKCSHLAWPIAVSLLGVVAFYGCAQVRKLTYPPDFVYLEKSQVENEMLRLGLNLERIDQVLLHGDAIDTTDRQLIVNLLLSIEAIAGSLGAGAGQTSHALIDRRIDQFRGDVTNARLAAQDQPPNYSPARRLSESCADCHRYRHR